MKLFKSRFVAVLLFISLQFVLFPFSTSKVSAYSNPATVPLLTVSNFSTLAKSLISSPTGPTTLNNGDLGVDSPGTCTGFASPCTGIINGTVNGGSIQYQNAVALQGQTDATAAVTNIGLRTADETLSADLTGLTLTQGIYEVPAAATNLTGDLTLNGDADSVFIFHLTSTFVTNTGSRVLLTGGVQACNVFWKVDSAATFEGTTTMVGTVLSQASISFTGGGATLNGRAIAQTAAVTFNNTTVNNSSCASVNDSSVGNLSNNGSSTEASSATAPNPYCPPLAPGITTPMIIESRRISQTGLFVSWGPFTGTDQFNIRYGPTNGNWLYNTDVTGFSTTLNSLPLNQPIWIQVAARNNCLLGEYGQAMFAGGPILPNAGRSTQGKNAFWYILTSLLVGSSIFLVLIRRKYRF